MQKFSMLWSLPDFLLDNVPQNLCAVKQSLILIKSIIPPNTLL